MPIQLFVSNHLNGLKEKLVEELQNATPSVFRPNYIISQTEGMNIWLKYNLAQEFGIAANNKFCKPNDILFEVYMCLEGKFQVTINRQSYVWIIFDVLGTSEFQNRYPDQCSFLEEDDDANDLKRLQLAEKIADLFDQYQIYRPEFISEWSVIIPQEAQHWQAFLWSKIEAYQNKSSKELHNINYVRNHILNNIDNPKYHDALRQQLPVIYLFGLSVFTKYHLEVFYKIAQVVDVQFYLINPAPYVYWGDDKSAKDIALWQAKGMPIERFIVGNELLTSWGKLIQNTLRLLFLNDITLNAYEPINVEAPQANSLLGLLKYEIFENLVLEERQEIPDAFIQDKSIQIHTHYTIQRELEGLYDFLLNQFEHAAGNLQARDILVVCSDINAYAPYIDGVFSNASVNLKYKIADTSVFQGDSVMSALDAIMALNENEFTANNFLSILSFDVVKQHLHIHQLDTIRAVIKAANIRSGINGSAADGTFTISWLNGIKRIMYGICMSDESILEGELGDFIPIDVIEGKSAMEVIRFCDFALQIITLIRNRVQFRTLHSWVDYTQGVLKLLLNNDGEELTEEMRYFNKLMEEFQEVTQFFDKPIAYDLFYAHFAQYLQEGNNASLFYGDGITFCTVVPMRSIPFKVVAMLGMDAKSFPRKEQKLSFNLMHQSYQLGDRNIKDSDKHLFLETVLSAEDTLYISYLGNSAKNNSIINPSSMVDELLNYIQIKTPLPIKEYLVYAHPLHAFSNLYNSQSSSLIHYTNFSTNPITIVKEKNETVQELSMPHSMSVAQLSKFIANPIKVYYNTAMGIYWNDSLEVPPEYEPFVLSGSLDIYMLRQKVFSILKSGSKDWDNFIKTEQLATHVPLQQVGKHFLESTKTDITAILDDWLPSDNGSFVQEPCSIQVGEVFIESSIEHKDGVTYDVVFAEKSYLKHFTKIFLKGMIAYRMGLIKRSEIKAVNRDDAKIIDWETYSYDEVDTYLNNLIQAYRKGLNNPIVMDYHLWEKIQIVLSQGALEKEDIYSFIDAHNIAVDYYTSLFLEHNKHHQEGLLIDIHFFNSVIQPILQ